MKPGLYIDFANDILIVYPNGNADMLTFCSYEWVKLSTEEVAVIKDATYLGPL